MLPCGSLGALKDLIHCFSQVVCYSLSKALIFTDSSLIIALTTAEDKTFIDLVYYLAEDCRHQMCGLMESKAHLFIPQGGSPDKTTMFSLLVVQNYDPLCLTRCQYLVSESLFVHAPQYD